MSKKKNGFLGKFGGLFSSTAQLQRIVILTGVVLLLGAGSFGAYYYFDRYYQPQTKQAEVQLKEAQAAVQADPNSITKRLDLADKYMMNKKWDEALSQLAQAEMANPTETQHQTILVNTGVCYYMLGKYIDAIDPLQQFVTARQDEEMASLDPQLKAAAYYLGDSLLRLERYDEAVKPLEQSVQWSKTDADAMYKLGVAYAKIGEDARALDMFTFTVAFVPDFAEAYQEMATIYQRIDQPAMVDYANGMVAYSQKDYEGALALLTKAESAKKDASGIYLGLGFVYEALKDNAKALESYDTVLKLDPANLSAINGSQRLGALMKK